MPPTDLDAWLPSPTIRTRHRRTARTDPATLWEAASAVRVADTRGLGRLIRWRLPGVSTDGTFRELFARPPFLVLDEGEHWSVSGMAGRIWAQTRDHPHLADADEYLAWDHGDSARVLFAHWVEETKNGSALISEARVGATGRRSSLRLRGLWTVVGPFERLIGGEALSLAARRAGAANAA